MRVNRGDLISWISHHDAYECGPTGVKGIAPSYRYGIVLEVSHKKTTAIIAHCFDCKDSKLVILDVDYDYVRLISEQEHG